MKKLGKAVGGASSGAALGTAIMPGLGTAIGGGLGFLGGLFSGDDPELQSPNFADINLQTDNPLMYEQILKNQQILDQLNQAVQTRRAGLSANERMDVDSQSAKLASAQASNGLAGTPIGQRMLNDQYQSMMGGYQDRAFQQQMAMQQLAAQQGMNVANLTRNALGDVAGQNQNNYQSAMASNAASDQMWNNMLGAGLQGYAQLNNQANWANMNGQKYDPMAIFHNQPSPNPISTAPVPAPIYYGVGGLGYGMPR